MACASVVGVVAPAAPAGAAVTVDGAGSTWSSIAVNQWRADVARTGLNINFNAVGSSAGRQFFWSDQVDFAVSEIPFQSAYRDSSGTVVTNEVALAAHRPYAYLPIVAGGTSFMYHLDINGRRFTNLNLAPQVVAKIFTGEIRTWNDPAIVATNPGVPLPALTIRPVTRADGSGTTAQFTAFMASQTPDVWNRFCAKVGLPTPCPATSLYPLVDFAVAKQLSDGVASFVAQSYNNGAITYVEYGYAKKNGFPVASVQNKAGYFTQPSAFNVAIALQGATLNADKTQNLSGVYNYNDPTFGKYAYPISSYSYMIVPKTTAKPFNTDKGAVLGKFITYMVCAGQQKAEQLGYSPLPRNLVAAAFDSLAEIPGAPPAPAMDFAHCGNPTLNGWPPRGNPPPPPTTLPQGGGNTGGQGNGGGNGGGNTGGGNTGGAGGSGTGGSGTGNGSAGGSGTGGSATGDGTGTGSGTDGAVFPGDVTGSGDGTGSGGVAANGQAIASSKPVTVPESDAPLGPAIVVLAVLALLALVFVPPVVAARLDRKRAPGAP